MTAWNPSLYDEKHAFVAQFGASLVEWLAPRSGERILDLGCGTGHLTAQIAAAGAEAIGIDSALEMIAAARQVYPHLRFEVADARTFAFADAFDAVFSNAALHWVRPPEDAARHIARALRRGGRFVAEFGGHGNVNRIVAAIRRLLSDDSALAQLPDWYFPTIGEYASLLEAAGLEPTAMQLFDRPTLLEGVEGLRNWVRMFAGGVVTALDAPRRESFFQELEADLRGELFRDGAWHADYRRLRLVAVRR